LVYKKGSEKKPFLVCAFLLNGRGERKKKKGRKGLRPLPFSGIPRSPPPYHVFGRKKKRKKKKKKGKRNGGVKFLGTLPGTKKKKIPCLCPVSACDSQAEGKEKGGGGGKKGRGKEDVEMN